MFHAPCSSVYLFLYLCITQSEERGTPSRRSKSEGPPVVPNGRTYPIASEVDGTTRKQVKIVKWIALPRCQAHGCLIVMYCLI